MASPLILLIITMTAPPPVGGRVVQQVPSEEYFMNYKQEMDCNNKMIDGTCPLKGGPYRLPNIFVPMNGTVHSDIDVRSTKKACNSSTITISASIAPLGRECYAYYLFPWHGNLHCS